jgi:hypothetical protein
MRMDGLIVACADVGSVAQKNFAWAVAKGTSDVQTGTEIEDLVQTVIKDLNDGLPLALGFECPLFVPLADNPVRLTSARPGDGNRPWSAASGVQSLAIGLVEATWVLNRIQQASPQKRIAYLRWPDFRATSQGLFLWEAMVTGQVKKSSHMADAQTAVLAFIGALPNIDNANAVKCDRVFSLIGAALLRSGWSTDLDLLSTPAVVIRAS